MEMKESSFTHELISEKYRPRELEGAFNFSIYLAVCDPANCEQENSERRSPEADWETNRISHGVTAQIVYMDLSYSGH